MLICKGIVKINNFGALKNWKIWSLLETVRHNIENVVEGPESSKTQPYEENRIRMWIFNFDKSLDCLCWKKRECESKNKMYI